MKSHISDNQIDRMVELLRAALPHTRHDQAWLDRVTDPELSKEQRIKCIVAFDETQSHAQDIHGEPDSEHSGHECRCQSIINEPLNPDGSEKKLIAASIVTNDPSNMIMHVNIIAVDPAYRRQGIAVNMIRSLRSAHPEYTIMVHANTALRYIMEPLLIMAAVRRSDWFDPNYDSGAQQDRYISIPLEKIGKLIAVSETFYTPIDQLALSQTVEAHAYDEAAQLCACGKSCERIEHPTHLAQEIAKYVDSMNYIPKDPGGF